MTTMPFDTRWPGSAGGGYRVIEARNGTETLRLADEGPDLITLDVHLPDMDGFEVCRRLKANPQTAHIPGVAHFRHCHRHRKSGAWVGDSRWLPRRADFAGRTAGDGRFPAAVEAGGARCSLAGERSGEGARRSLRKLTTSWSCEFRNARNRRSGSSAFSL